MTTRLNAIAQGFLAASAAVFFMTGCRSVTTLRMYSGPDVPSDQLSTLVVPWCVGLRTVDGAPAPSTLTDEMRILLKPGSHSLEARYVVLYPTSGSDTEKIASDYISLTFTGEAGKTYTVCSKDPKTLAETRAYARHVSLWIEEGQRGKVEAPATQTQAAPAVSSTSTNVTAETAASATRPGTPDIQKQLQQTWDKADERERKAFLDKVLQPHP